MFDLPPTTRNLRDVVQAVRQLIQGRSNATGAVTVDISTTTTTIDLAAGNENAGVWLFPTTANAAAELAAGTIYALVTDAETVTITHANNTQADRTYYYMVVGG